MLRLTKQALFTKFEMKLGKGKRFGEDVGGRKKEWGNLTSDVN